MGWSPILQMTDEVLLSSPDLPLHEQVRAVIERWQAAGKYTLAMEAELQKDGVGVIENDSVPNLAAYVDAATIQTIKLDREGAPSQEVLMGLACLGLAQLVTGRMIVRRHMAKEKRQD